MTVPGSHVVYKSGRKTDQEREALRILWRRSLRIQTCELKEEEARKRKELEEIMAENNKKIEEAQRKLAEERLAMIEEQRKMDEERQKLKKEQEKRIKEEQRKILGKNNSRPKLSFSLNTLS